MFVRRVVCFCVQMIDSQKVMQKFMVRSFPHDCLRWLLADSVLLLLVAVAPSALRQLRARRAKVRRIAEESRGLSFCRLCCAVLGGCVAMVSDRSFAAECDAHSTRPGNFVIGCSMFAVIHHSLVIQSRQGPCDWLLGVITHLEECHRTLQWTFCLACAHMHISDC